MVRLALSILLLSPLAGCGGSSVCRTTCDYYVSCTPEQLDDDFDLQCDWDDEGDAFEACTEICEGELEDLDDEDQREVHDCVACVYDENDGSCDASDYFDALDDCDELCEDNDVEEFFGDFGEDWGEEALEELECD